MRAGYGASRNGADDGVTRPEPNDVQAGGWNVLVIAENRIEPQDRTADDIAADAGELDLAPPTSPANAIDLVQLRNLTDRIHRAGERSLFELFREFDLDPDVVEAIERYAALNDQVEPYRALDRDQSRILHIVARPGDRPLRVGDRVICDEVNGPFRSCGCGGILFTVAPGVGPHAGALVCTACHRGGRWIAAKFLNGEKT